MKDVEILRLLVQVCIRLAHEDLKGKDDPILDIMLHELLDARAVLQERE